MKYYCYNCIGKSEQCVIIKWVLYKKGGISLGGTRDLGRMGILFIIFFLSMIYCYFKFTVSSLETGPKPEASEKDIK